MIDTSKAGLLAEIERLNDGITRRQADLRMVKAKVARIEQTAYETSRRHKDDVDALCHKLMVAQAERDAAMVVVRLLVDRGCGGCDEG